MSTFHSLRLGLGSKRSAENQSDPTTANLETPVAMHSVAMDDREIGPPAAPDDTEVTDDLKNMAGPSEDLQRGIQGIEAVTLAWTKTSLAAVLILYVSILVVYAQALHATYTTS